MTDEAFVARVAQLFADRGWAEYHGEAVSQLEHALQAAALAEADGQPNELVVAALLHDIGHLLHGHGEDSAERGIDDAHEELGFRFLTRHLGPAVCEPVWLHVPAKRYLCAVEPAYFDGLSPASVQSLHLQGGPMSPAEAAAFEANPRHVAAVALRRYDDRAKVPHLPTPPFDHFRPHLEAAVARH